MMTLMLVFRGSMIVEVEELLKKNGVNAYTLLNKAEGKGVTGNVVRSFFYPGSNSVILSVLLPGQAKKVVSALKLYHAARVQAAHGQAIPLKLFAFPCEELI